jgi:hypothetical protein
MLKRRSCQGDLFNPHATFSPASINGLQLDQIQCCAHGPRLGLFNGFSNVS